ncbi:MAG: GFA family protein [Alphaproteobacteria bacterium]
MTMQGGCYCGEIRYESGGDLQGAIQCHCRECQYITGGNPNVIVIVPADGFKFTKGEPKSFTRSDLESPVTRLFCENCGTGIGTRTPRRPDSVILKVGTLDDPSIFQAKAAIFTCDAQPFHVVPEGIPAFEKMPG